jgi:serine/threonine protein kinase
VIGTVFAGHRIESQVGRGGMGVVYRARHCRLDRLAALKVIAPDLLEDPAARERFREEAVVAASLEHPNIVPVHDAGEADGIAYLAMRYVRGTDLALLVRGLDPLGPARAAEIVARVAGALDCLHDAGYVHRDVKPRNVLIARDGHVYLTDFGLARSVAGDAGATRAGQWVGTVDYVAPEQIRGLGAGPRADVYGLGCVLFFALTGCAPFDGETPAARLWAHLHEPPPAPSRLRPGLPSALDEAVVRALAKDPADRFRSAGELGRAALRAARAAAAATAAPPRPRTAGPAEAPTVTCAGRARGPAGLTAGRAAVT